MHKRKVMILFISMVIYILLIFAKEQIGKNNLQDIYVLTKNLSRGEKIDVSNTKKISINKLNMDINYVENVENAVAKTNLNTGQILTEENIINSNEYSNLDSKDKEIILIKVSNNDTNIHYDISNGSIVNIYYTGRSSQLEKMPKNIYESIIESSSIADGYTTFLLLKEIEIKNVYNRNGEVLNKKNNINRDNIDTISVEVDNNMAMLIENIKKYGTFSLTVKR